MKQEKAIDSARALALQIEAAKSLTDSIRALVEGDPEFLRDVLEGETGLFEGIDALVLSIKEDEALHEATTALADSVRARAVRIKERIAIKRSLVASAMAIAEIYKRETPAGVVSRKAVAPVVIVTDESAIPSVFWKAQAPRLDKAALAAALKGGDTIPGATLSNGSETVQIRT